MKYDSIVVGAGFAGAVVARELAMRGNRKVLLLEKRAHIAGNCYDRLDTNGIMIHQYGPHIFHTNHERVYEYLSQFTDWYEYQHQVTASVNGRNLPVPFNLNTLDMVFDKEMADRLTLKLIRKYGEGAKVPILELLEQEDEELQNLADFVYKNIFLTYTMKQWGQKPEEISKEVTARVPIVLSRDNRYFQDIYQGMPLRGYTALIQNIVSHSGINLSLMQDAKEYISILDDKVIFDGNEFQGEVIYTGALDEFFDGCFGRLPYRSLHFVMEEHKVDSYQENAVVNYTVSEEYTRITEFKKLTGQMVHGVTTIMKEYPIAYTNIQTQIPYYAILNQENEKLYQKYKIKVDKCKNFYLLGRLAEYKYYNIDAIVERALCLADNLLSGHP